MFRSIRWRLVASYIFVTLLTVCGLGILAFTFVRQYMENQDLTYLRSNAKAVAQKANQFFQPVTQESELFDLANAVVYLGNVWIRILNADRDNLVDIESPTEFDQFLWVIPPREGLHWRHMVVR